MFEQYTDICEKGKWINECPECDGEPPQMPCVPIPCEGLLARDICTYNGTTCNGTWVGYRNNTIQFRDGVYGDALFTWNGEDPFAGDPTKNYNGYVNLNMNFGANSYSHVFIVRYVFDNVTLWGDMHTETKATIFQGFGSNYLTITSTVSGSIFVHDGYNVINVGGNAWTKAPVWTLITVTKDENNFLKLYLQGDYIEGIQSEPNAPAPAGIPNPKSMIGALQDPNQGGAIHYYASMYLDKYCYFNRAVTAEEVENMYCHMKRQIQWKYG